MSKRSLALSRYEMSEHETRPDVATAILKAGALSPRWAIANGCRWFQSSGLNYDPKLHLRHRLKPVDLYVRHTSPIVNMFMRLALPLLEPTRHDATLKKFPNYFDLWGSGSRASPSSNGAARARALATADLRKGWGASRN